MTSIVATVEVQFSKTSTGSVKIDLSRQAKHGEITIVEVTAPEMAAVTNLFTDLFTNSFAQGIDDGETEGLAVMSRGGLTLKPILAA